MIGGVFYRRKLDDLAVVPGRLDEYIPSIRGTVAHASLQSYIASSAACGKSSCL